MLEVNLPEEPLMFFLPARHGISIWAIRIFLLYVLSSTFGITRSIAQPQATESLVTAIPIFVSDFELFSVPASVTSPATPPTTPLLHFLPLPRPPLPSLPSPPLPPHPLPVFLPLRSSLLLSLPLPLRAGKSLHRPLRMEIPTRRLCKPAA